MSDRSAFLRSLFPNLPNEEEHQRYPFRQMFLKEKDADITEIVLNYFSAVRDRWPTSWDDLTRRGNVLPKTNGVKALMRFLKPLYLAIAGRDRERVPEIFEFARHLDHVPLGDEDFNIKTFPPGTSGEAGLYRILIATLKKNEPAQQVDLF
ncbi:hypothetical protein D3C71_1574020 [compost metagenome]